MKRIAAALVCLIWSQAVLADSIDRLMDALRVADRLALLEQEGADLADQIDQDFLDGGGGAVWAEQAARIQSPERLLPRFREALEARLKAADIEPALAWLESDAGRRVSDLELDARAVFLDPKLADAARRKAREGDPDDTVERMIEAGDLVERNVAASLQAQLKFLEGFAMRSAKKIDREKILDQVTSQTDAIRADTSDWLHGYLLLAYSPMEAGTRAALLDFAESPLGQRVIGAVFDAFADINEEIAFALGQAAGRLAPTDDI